MAKSEHSAKKAPGDRPVVSFYFGDGTIGSVPLSKVLDDERRQLEKIARLEGDRGPIDAYREKLALAWFRAHEQEKARVSGGRKRAKNRKEVDPNAWMRPIFDKAYARLEAECRARIGQSRLLGEAWRVAGKEHPRRDELTEHHAREYLKARRTKSRE